MGVGAPIANLSEEFWGSPSADGNTINFWAMTTNNPLGTVFLLAPVALASNSWTFIALNYDTNSSVLYTNSQVAATGQGVSLWPGPGTIASGLCLGGTNGYFVPHAYFDNLTTYSGMVDAGNLFSPL